MLPISTCAHLACILEVTARKPGNVHRYRDYADVTLLDFLVSAAVSCPVLDRLPEIGVGPALLEAVERTRQVVRTNTNLGILLLLTPLAAVPRQEPLREGIYRVLEQLTVADARAAYAAIRLAQPGGLGEASEQDVAREPTVTLRQAMDLAADRDLIARQYANGYRGLFEIGVPALLEGVNRGLPIEEAIIGSHLRLMAACPDTLIARKRGLAEAEESARRAQEVLDLGWPETAESRQAFADLDRWLRAVGHQRNPGTTADLVTASLFAALREDSISLPADRPWFSQRL
jgi:triphosphoribosyl-dephospho-CoA synthase